MNVLLVPFGSHGDVHPFVGLALALRARGHRVRFLINEYFGPLVRGLGFESDPLGPDDAITRVIQDPDLWNPRRAFPLVAGGAVRAMRPIVEWLGAHDVPGQTVAVGGSLALGVRVAQERLGVPAVTVHLQPGILPSSYETPVYGGLALPRWYPRWVKRSLFHLIHTYLADPHLAPALNAYRAELGLRPPVRRVMLSWWNSPQLVLGLFPAWFGPPQPDWPPRVKLVGFPLYDEREVSPVPPELEAFLAAGEPPVVFTPGSAMRHGGAFFEAAVAACARLGRRGVLLTRFAEQVPAALPASVRHVAYAPFGQLLPRAVALVHHGGIGTCAQAMAAGVPQLVMPLAHDQHDNAARLARLGVARALPPGRFTGPTVAEALEALLSAPEVARSCRAVAGRFAEDPAPLEAACEAIEGLRS